MADENTDDSCVFESVRVLHAGVGLSGQPADVCWLGGVGLCSYLLIGFYHEDLCWGSSKKASFSIELAILECFRQ